MAVLLTSEKFVKDVTSISDNVDGKYLRPSILEAQENALRPVLGDTLMDRLCELVANVALDIPDHKAYKTLLDRCQFFLAYSAVAEVITKVTYKIGNFGVARSNDENLSVVDQDENAKVKFYYQSKADAACINLQNFLLSHSMDYPELTKGDCHRLSASLDSAETCCSLYLGGERGRRM